MPNARSFNNAYRLDEFTDELLLIPNSWGLIQSLNLFREEGVSKHYVQFDEENGTLGLIRDMPRGERAILNKWDPAKLHVVPIPFFPFDDAIKPEDIQGRREPGTTAGDATLASVRARKMIRMRRSWAATMEYAKAQALQGIVYAPNGTVSLNWYTEMGQSQKSVDFVFGTTTTNMIAKIEEVIAHVQDNILSGEMVDDFVFLCSPEFFSALISHPTVTNAFQYYSSTQEPLRNRLGRGRFRQFEYGGATFIEYRGAFDGNRIIPAGEAYAVPLGTMDTFVTYYGPAVKFATVNTEGLPQYWFEYDNGRDTEITIESESSFLNMVRRPQAVVKAFSSTGL